MSRILVDAGFAAPTFEAHAEPMYFGPNVRTAERFVLGVLGWLLTDLDDTARKQALDALRNRFVMVRPQSCCRCGQGDQIRPITNSLENKGFRSEIVGAGL